MSYEFTADEIRETVSAARIYSPGYIEEYFQASTELVKRLPESGYLEAVCGLARLEEERGITCARALEGYEQLLSDKAQLETEVTNLQEKFAAQQDANQQAHDRYRQIKETAEQAKKQLEEVKAEREREERELVLLGKKAERGKQRIDREVEEYQQKANVTREEITSASKLKEQLASGGFTIEFTLDLCQEFVGHESAREELAKALKEHQTLTNYIASLSEWAKGQKEALESELNKLKSEKDGRQAEIKDLEQTRNQLENIIGQLQADVAHEEELRRFYHRYYGWSGYLEWLASWEQVFLMHCDNPVKAVTGGFDHRAGGAHVWIDKAGPKCPHCGLNTLDWDKGLYQALNLPPGTPFKIQLGE